MRDSIEYFAVMDEDGVRRGPFATMDEATRFLQDVALVRGYTDEQADQFFLRESAVVKVETTDGAVVFYNLNCPGREASAKRKIPIATSEGLPEMVMAKVPLRGKRKC
jgi:hypothetical protein